MVGIIDGVVDAWSGKEAATVGFDCLVGKE